MKTIGLLMVIVMLAGMGVGCVSVSAPEKVEVNADAGSGHWNDVANRYVRQYGNSDKDE